MLANYFAIVVALARIIWLMMLKFQADGLVFLANTSLAVVNIVVACVCTVLDLIGIAITAWHLCTTWRAP